MSAMPAMPAAPAYPLLRSSWSKLTSALPSVARPRCAAVAMCPAVGFTALSPLSSRRLPLPSTLRPPSLHCSIFGRRNRRVVGAGKDVGDPRGDLGKGTEAPLPAPATSPVSPSPSPSPGSAVALGVWALYVAYMTWLFVLPYAPGQPAWDIDPATFEELTSLSLNFFFILPLLNLGGFHGMEAPTLHPVAEALFNFVVAWTLLLGPVLIADAKRRLSPVTPSLAAALWAGQTLLTNVFMIPYMALRLGPTPVLDVTSAKPGEEGAGILARLADALERGRKGVAVVGCSVALLSLYWAIAGRQGEGFGDSLEERWAFFVEYISSDRLAYAFVVDIFLYILFQTWLVYDIFAVWGRQPGWDKALRLACWAPCFGIAPLLFFYV